MMGIVILGTHQFDCDMTLQGKGLDLIVSNFNKSVDLSLNIEKPFPNSNHRSLVTMRMNFIHPQSHRFGSLPIPMKAALC